MRPRFVSGSSAARSRFKWRPRRGRSSAVAHATCVGVSRGTARSRPHRIPGAACKPGAGKRVCATQAISQQLLSRILSGVGLRRSRDFITTVSVQGSMPSVVMSASAAVCFRSHDGGNGFHVSRSARTKNCHRRPQTGSSDQSQEVVVRHQNGGEASHAERRLCPAGGMWSVALRSR
jgi:hypothetical protein